MRTMASLRVAGLGLCFGLGALLPACKEAPGGPTGTTASATTAAAASSAPVASTVASAAVVASSTAAPHPSFGQPPMVAPGLTPPRLDPSLSWTAPKRWKAMHHKSTMRIATFDVPHAAGDSEDAELSITRAGGDLPSNVGRWTAQFGAEGHKTVKTTERTLAGLHASFVEIHGSYQGMGMNEPKAGYRLLGAIVETAGGSHFFKLVGPEKSVEAARAEFDQFLSSLKPLATDGG